MRGVHAVLRDRDIDRFDLPFAVPQVEIALYTYRRALPDPGVEWQREAIRAAVHEWAALHARG